MEMLNDGILSIDETEGEEISLTAEAPQFTEEERLRIESEKEEGDDEDVKRIDLFASEEQGDPLNNLLLGEDGITTLFQAKDGGSPQLVKKSKDGKRPGYRGPGGYQSGQSDPASDQGETSADSGFGNTGPSNVGGNDNNQGSDQGHSRFDVGSGYYGEPVTDKGERGDTITNNPETFYDDEITRKDPIERIKTNYVDRKDKYEKTQRKDALTFMAKAAFFGINPYSVYDFGKKQNQKKTDYINSVKKDIETLKDLGVPTYSPHTDTLIQTLEQDILDLTQPKSRDDDKKDDDNTPAIQEIVVAKETIEDRDETDIFNIWDKIKAKQAQRSMLVEKGIIQDNTQDQTMMLNSGGLANLFRVKTQ